MMNQLSSKRKVFASFSKVFVHHSDSVLVDVGSMEQSCKELTLSTKIRLNDGCEIPMIGLGTFMSWDRTIEDPVLLPNAPTDTSNSLSKEDLRILNAITHALKCGYAHIDSAQWYNTECLMLRAIANAKMKRSDVFVTSKLIAGINNDAIAAQKSILNSIRLLGGYIDLFLIHGPKTSNGGLDCLQIYKMLHKLKNQGYIKSVGVSNFNIQHLQCFDIAKVPKPSINQIECHPFLVPRDLLQYCSKNNIKIAAYCPLARAKKFGNGLLVKLAKKYKKSEAQIMLRWGLQQGLIVLPQSTNLTRIAENCNVFDFEIHEQDMHQMLRLEKENLRVSWDIVETEKWDSKLFEKLASKL